MNQVEATLTAVLRNPAIAFSPTPIWWWSGEKLDAGRLRWQMEQLVAGGVYNVVILNLAPAGPLYGKDADDPRLFSDAWWEIFEGVCRDAKELGVRIYFYDQIGFSGANFQGQLAARDPSYRGREIICHQEPVVAGQTMHLPAECEPLAAFFWADGAETPQRIPFAGYAAAAPASGRLQLMGALVKGFDYYNPAACAALLNAVHGQFEARMGKYLQEVIVGSFQDELPNMPTWSADFADRFRVRYGYDLVDRLWMLWEGQSLEAMRTRVDYHALRAERAEAAFFKPFYDWHDKHGLICGFDQQSPARAGDLFGGVRIYGDYLKTHRWYAAPGSDLHGEAHVHRALADHYDRPRLWIEGFHSTGWGGTLEETFDWLLPWMRNGSNLYNPHAVYYGTRGGWWEWAAPSTCFRQPYWRHYKSFASAVAGCCEALTLGRHDCDLAVYYPTITAQAGACQEWRAMDIVTEAQDKLRQLGGKTRWPGTEIGQLDALGRDYNFLDDTMLESAAVRNGALHVGHQRYRTIILPSATVMRTATLELMLDCVDAGITLIVFGKPPTHVLDDPAGRVLRRWQAACDRGQIRQAQDPAELGRLLQEHPPLISSPFPIHHRKVDDGHIAFVPAAVLRATEGVTWDRSKFAYPGFHQPYVFDRDRYARTLTITIRQSNIAVSAWSPVTATRRPIDVQPVPEGTRITLYFDDGPALWLAWQPDAAGVGQRATPQRTVRTLATLPTIWQCKLTPTVNNRYGDMQLPPSPTLPVQTWFVEQVASDADAPAEIDWSTAGRAHATFGVFGWRKVTSRDEMLAPSTDAQPPGEGWEPVSYSLSRGKEVEERNIGIGPSGYVAEEFLDLGHPREGEASHFLTWVSSDTQQHVLLMVGGPGEKQVAWNGQMLEAKTGYRQLWPVTLQPGLNRLDFRMGSDWAQDRLRAQWGLMTRPLQRPWPQRIGWPGESLRNRLCRFRREIELPQASTGGVMQIISRGATTFYLDGKEIGRHGAFAPYTHPRRYEAYRYLLPPLPAGTHTLEVAIIDGGLPPQFTLDGEFTFSDGRAHGVCSDEQWTVTAHNQTQAQPVALPSGSYNDSGHEALHRRPHPLPRTAWLEQWSEPSPMLDVTPQAFPGQPHRCWFRWQTPPGAAFMTLRVIGDARLWIDGEPVPTPDHRIKLPQNSRKSCQIVLRVDAAPGYRVGAIFAEAVTYDMSDEPGQIPLGDWTQHGLEAWSGGVAYSQQLTLDEVPDGRLLLDLGDVRGTVEVHVNGQKVGERFCAPWQFDMTKTLHPGGNTIDVSVFNTLAPWLKATSPTTFVYPGQTVSGLMGPVRLYQETSTAQT